MNNKYLKKIHFKKFPIKNGGFTFLEFILAVSLLGITSSIVIPFISSTLNRSKQREANLIVSSIIKSAKAHYAIFGNLPENMGQLSTFASYAKCNEEEVNIKGNEVCKESKKYLVEKNDIYYFSPSGNYKIEIELSDTNIQEPMFLVKAIQMAIISGRR